LFGGLTKENYPVYDVNNLLNTHDTFDFSQFEELPQKLKDFTVP